jgi:hypothetical protein
VTIGKDVWDWDGKKLRREEKSTLPVRGMHKTEITPDPSVTVKISDNAQVSPDTEFVD